MPRRTKPVTIDVTIDAVQFDALNKVYSQLGVDLIDSLRNELQPMLKALLEHKINTFRSAISTLSEPTANDSTVVDTETAVNQ